MADVGETSVKAFLLTGALVLLAFVGLGLWFLFAPGQELDRAAGDHPDRAEVGNIENEEARDSLARKLVLNRYNLERAPAVVSGSVVNNTSRPFVNVQVGFRLLNARGDTVGTVRDTTPIVEADDSWPFRVNFAPDQTVARVEPYDLQGTPKVPLGPEAESVRRPEQGLGDSIEDSGGQ
jgi:hypothetical protein